MQVVLKTFNEKIDVFLEYAFKKLQHKKVTAIISTDKYVMIVEENIKCNGYFYEDDGSDLMFGIAIGKPLNKWFPVFVHEFCHFEQFCENKSKWDSLKDDDLWYWVGGTTELKPRELTIAINDSRDLEHDCELRVIKKIKEFQLPIDAERYSQQAAAYILFYNYMLKHRKWYKMGKEPYRNEKLMKLMPKKLPTIKSRKLKMTPAMERLYNECV